MSTRSEAYASHALQATRSTTRPGRHWQAPPPLRIPARSALGRIQRTAGALVIGLVLSIPVFFGWW
jgi:hypothetical protein